MFQQVMLGQRAERREERYSDLFGWMQPGGLWSQRAHPSSSARSVRGSKNVFASSTVASVSTHRNFRNMCREIGRGFSNVKVNMQTV